MTHEEKFVKEIIEYVFAYPDDDYMTMECLCRKLHKYGLIDKKDGEWTTDFIDHKTENSSDIPNNCDTCKHYLFTDIDGHYCEHETYGQPCGYEPKDEPQTDCAWR